MRSMFAPTLALVSLLALPALADDTDKKEPEPKVRCAIHSKNGSRAVQGSDLIVKAGEKIKDAVAIDGNITIRKGAVVEDVVVIQGKVTIEEGAEVKGDVIALGGDLVLKGKARVDGDVVALGGSLRMDEDASVGGKQSSLSINLNGKDLARSFVDKALENSDCRLSFGDDEKE
ncbi:polymer-forming cytoskeletal protein [Hyalangium rubrum]|uniref:Polymer-forming cytoskeletal protein n=1 Tax=Hyalangium rubrum TaxID=3103134 RepID=A0ABU5HD45_9BACT|nr:polymer-forming cytoskeletal protein [Hyalangium sp. s54d21]MDY7231052.1 polymer-forming cytoskeletal protein [Hyalangium sp. s54d21]